MIASLRGTVIDKGLDFLVLECHGVGYHCSATPETLAILPRGEEAFVYTTLVVREDAQLLFAFPSPEEKATFGLLQTVSGVAAKTALGIMAVISPGEIARAIQESDLKTLQRANGVGKKLAERMVLELRDKVAALGTAPAAGDIAIDTMATPNINESIKEQVTEALVGLGFTTAKAATQVEATLAALAEQGNATLDASVILRQALAGIGKR